VVDALGRTIEEISPGGNVTVIVYLDTDHEVRTYRGSSIAGAWTPPGRPR